jgi:WD40 repeat protein
VAAAGSEFTQVARILRENCLECHAAQDPEAHFVMETYETLMKGGESGVAIVPGKSGESLLVKMIEGSIEKEGKKKFMPPGKRRKLDSAEVQLVRAWIDAGAQAPPDAVLTSSEIVTPKISPLVPPANPIQAVAYEPKGKLAAVARFGAIYIVSTEEQSVVRTLSGHQGKVTAVVFSPDGMRVFGAGGEPGLNGEVREWDVATGQLRNKY